MEEKPEVEFEEKPDVEFEEKPEVEFEIAALHRMDDDKLTEIADRVLASEKGASALRSMMRSVMRSAIRSAVKSAARSPQR